MAGWKIAGWPEVGAIGSRLDHKQITVCVMIALNTIRWRNISHPTHNISRGGSETVEGLNKSFKLNFLHHPNRWNNQIHAGHVLAASAAFPQRRQSLTTITPKSFGDFLIFLFTVHWPSELCARDTVQMSRHSFQGVRWSTWTVNCVCSKWHPNNGRR